MRREPDFVLSHNQYAVDLSSLVIDQRTRDDGTFSYSGRVDAVWFRRRRGVTVACIGTLHGLVDARPCDAADFLKMHDSSWGGDCEGRWDGTGYWGAQRPATIDAHLELLGAMLDNYPAAPEGYDGWWRF